MANACLRPIFSLAFLVGVTAGFPWALREGEVLRPIYAEPVLRWTLEGLVYATVVPALAVYACALARGLSLRLPDAGGRRLEESQAPRLRRMLAEMSQSLDALAVEEVRISPERTLEIRHEPCSGLGILGRSRTILVVGLPLAEELSPQQFRAMVAHELGHLGTHKRRFGGRALGMRARLAVLRQAAEANALERGFWSRLPDESLVDTLHRTVRRLTPVMFPAVRQHEAEADAIAAAIAGREYAASALLRQRIAGHAVDHQFQEMCLRAAEVSAEVPADLLERRAVAARGAFTEAQVSAWLSAELEMKDNLTDSHPPLWDRLRLLGFRVENIADFRELLEQVQPQRELGETAARFFLGDVAGRVRDEFFRDWAAQQTGNWRKRFAVYESLRIRAAEWENGTAAMEAEPGALWQAAVAVGNTKSWRAALPLAERILAIAPEHADANLLKAQLLLEEGNPAGIEALERAMKSDARMVTLACTLASRFLERRGEQETAASYQNRCEEHHKREQESARERSQVRAKDMFLPPNCPPATTRALLGAVELHAPHIRTAYLMRKQGQDGKAQHVLGLERRSLPFENTALANRLLLERIMRSPNMPADVLVCVVTRANRALVAKWKGTPQSVLYPHASAVSAEAMGTQPGSANLLRQPPASLPAQSSPAAAK